MYQPNNIYRCWFSIQQWDGMKKAIEQFREPEDRQFADVDLPITTENFDPALNRANTNHCLLVAREKGNTIFVVVGTKWTEGSKFVS
jgi:hypothetical protein